MLQHKRYLAGLLAAAMTFSLAACGNSTEQMELIDNPNQAAADGTMELPSGSSPRASSTPMRPTRNCTKRPRKRAR